MKSPNSFHLLLFLILPLQIFAAVPDSLITVKEQLLEQLNRIERIESNIVTPDDLDIYRSRIEQLRDNHNRIKDRLFDCNELWDLWDSFRRCDDRIQEHIAEWERRNQRKTLINKMNRYSHSMDSLLTIGQGFASRKSADSVRSVKNRADDKWGEVTALKASSENEFEQDTLKSLYKHIESVRGQIQDLSDKERMKAKDILLLAAAVIAAVAMILTLVRSITLTKKTKETPSIEI